MAASNGDLGPFNGWSVVTLSVAMAVAARRPRDHYMDALRVTSLGVVIAYHWLALLPSWRNGKYVDRTLPTLVPGVWPLTWFIDILPVFLFVGGFANATSYRLGAKRGESDMRFLRRRLRRLLVPTFVLLGIWEGLNLTGQLLGGAFSFPGLFMNVRNTAPFGQLWFLGVYLIQIAFVPITLRLHDRFGWGAVGGIVAVVAMLDLTAAVIHSPAPLAFNFLMVWMVAHQLGYFYADNRLQQFSLGSLFIFSCAGFATLALLTSLPPYPRDLLDPSYKLLGINAPTAPLVAQAFGMIGLMVILRPRAQTWLQRGQRRLGLVHWANARIMLMFLWHTTAFLLAVLLLQPLPDVWSVQPDGSWWIVRPAVVIAAGLMMGLILLIDRWVRSWRRGIGVKPAISPRRIAPSN